MDDELEIGARNLMLCRQVTYDTNDIAAPYSLHHVLTRIRRVMNTSALITQPIYLYAEFFGAPGDYEIWIDLVEIGYDAGSGEAEVTSFGPFDLTVLPDTFVCSRFYCLKHVPFPNAGVFEFRLNAAGVFEPLTTHRFYVEN